MPHLQECAELAHVSLERGAAGIVAHPKAAMAGLIPVTGSHRKKKGDPSTMQISEHTLGPCEVCTNSTTHYSLLSMNIESLLFKAHYSLK